MKCKILGTYTAWLVIALVLWFPIIWIALASFKSLVEFSAYPPRLLPASLTFANYIAVFKYSNLLVYMRNTLIIMFFTTLGTLVSSSIVAYPLARINFPGRGSIFAIVMATMMIPAFVTIIPQYILFMKLKWLDTFWPIIVPAWFGYPFNIFLFRQFYRTIPRELDEAAKIDGASEWQIFRKIILPLSRPIFVTIGILSSIFWWNEFFTPMVFIKSEKLKPLSVGVYSFARTVFTIRWDWLMAMAVLMLIPPLVLFVLGRRYITEGIKTYGLK